MYRSLFFFSYARILSKYFNFAESATKLEKSTISNL